MNIQENELYRIIFESIQEQDTEIHAVCQKGVFFAPELHLSFEIGKAIHTQRKNIFMDEAIEWERESPLGPGGLTDLAFKSKNGTVAIEVKVASTLDLYVADIRKLKDLKNVAAAYFLAMADSFHPERDERLEEIKKLGTTEVRLVGTKSFKTWHTFKNQIHCHVALFRITS